MQLPLIGIAVAITGKCLAQFACLQSKSGGHVLTVVA